ncbi:MAG: hypothetical protein LC102_10520 [Ignavibacteriales bacterium]|nr:MAG: hypothetical protein F9K26_10480 [Ignavibacteriaceae bacterium]MBW7873618.1 hypothetical protein [Ignavibacteria bacterium]MCZ2143848.1 hypothetical protein [Ignavibacteriales bacterium]OQY71289.1 MAG: hypothetical protein B6D45_10240 [Ignavibacteriales bacterium UTCHB3]MBV6445881.1 hypothetical protein [Ignavibacteriaceae bacterium]
MKNRMIIIVFSLLLSFSAFSQAVQIQIVNPLPTVDLTQFINAKDLCGAPEVFLVRLNPKGIQGYIKAKFEWKDIGKNNYSEVYRMQTNPFTIRDFYSTDLCNSEITVFDETSNNDLLQDALAKGVTVGSYRITVELYDANGNFLGAATENREFTNPTATLAMIQPVQLMSYPENAVPASWNPVIGATSYRIKAVRVTSIPASLEAALENGIPCIENVDVGSVTQVNNLASLQSQNPWRPGDFVVVRVTAVVPGAQSVQELNSNIILFQIANPDAPQSSVVAQLITSLMSFLPPNLVSPEVQQFLVQYGSSITGYQGDAGQSINVNEFLNILNMIIANPDILSNIYIQQ